MHIFTSLCLSFQDLFTIMFSSFNFKTFLILLICLKTIGHISQNVNKNKRQLILPNKAEQKYDSY